MLDLLIDPRTWESLATLTVLEIVLGIDNLIFISILSGQLPAAQQPAARRIGLSIALAMRIALLSVIAWVMSLSTPFVALFGEPISWRDVILAAGGLFLLYKGTSEINKLMTGEEDYRQKAAASFAAVIVQIMLLDIVFSLDSVITAVGMVRELWVMITAVIGAVALMMLSAEAISDFVHRHPTVKMLALSFLLLIGMSCCRRLRAAFRGIYFAMGFGVRGDGQPAAARSRWCI